MSDDVYLAALLEKYPSLHSGLEFLVSLCESGDSPSDELIDQVTVIVTELVEAREKRSRRSA